MYDWVRPHNHLQTWHDGKLNYFIQAVTGRKFRRIECGSKTCFKLKISNGCQGRRGRYCGTTGICLWFDNSCLRPQGPRSDSDEYEQCNQYELQLSPVANSR